VRERGLVSVVAAALCSRVTPTRPPSIAAPHGHRAVECSTALWCESAYSCLALPPQS
jgi:hypothetical protein